MEYVNFKIGETFDEVIKDGGKNFYEIFVVSEKGSTPKRYLCTIRVRDDGWRKIIIITPYDKFGRVIYGWRYPFNIALPRDANIKEYTKSDTIEPHDFYSLSRGKVYQHCMGMLRNKIHELKKKEIKIHETIYGL